MEEQVSLIRPHILIPHLRCAQHKSPLSTKERGTIYTTLTKHQPSLPWDTCSISVFKRNRFTGHISLLISWQSFSLFLNIMPLMKLEQSTVTRFSHMLFPLRIWRLAFTSVKFWQNKLSSSTTYLTFPSPFTHWCKFTLEPDLVSPRHADTVLARIIYLPVFPQNKPSADQVMCFSRLELYDKRETEENYLLTCKNPSLPAAGKYLTSKNTFHGYQHTLTPKAPNSLVPSWVKVHL